MGDGVRENDARIDEMTVGVGDADDDAVSSIEDAAAAKDVSIGNEPACDAGGDGMEMTFGERGSSSEMNSADRISVSDVGIAATTSAGMGDSGTGATG